MGNKLIWRDLLLDRKELRKRWIMGTIQPELFYIPWKKKESNFYIDVMYEDGTYCTNGEIIITYQSWGDYMPDDNYGSYNYHYGGRVFDKTGRYPNPVSDINRAEQPDLTTITFSVDGAEIKENGINKNSICLRLKGKRITLTGLPIGSYAVDSPYDNYDGQTCKMAPLWCNINEPFILYPNYYEPMGKNDRRTYFQFNHKHQPTGLDINTYAGDYYKETYERYDKNFPNGYHDVKYIEPPFKDNILPIVANEGTYSVYPDVLYQRLNPLEYYDPVVGGLTFEHWQRSDYWLENPDGEAYNNNRLIYSGDLSRVDNLKKHENIIKCTVPPVFAHNKILPSKEVIYFRENKEEKTVDITEQDYYNYWYKHNDSSIQAKAPTFKFDVPSIRFEFCWMPLPAGVAHITEKLTNNRYEGCQDSGNSGLAIKMYVEGKYKGYVMFGFHICGVPLYMKFREDVRETRIAENKVGCRVYPNYYIFDDGEIEPNGDSYNIIRMSTYPNAPRVISPFYEFCKISKHHLNDYHLRASNSLIGYGPHVATDISLMWENVWTSHYVLYALHNYQVDVDHQKNCSNNGREFENIFKCKCLNETKGIDLTDHQCQTYYYLGDGITKEECSLILSSVWYRQDSIEQTYSTE